MNIKEITRWTSKTIYVDIETGQEISKRTREETRQEIQNKYQIIKTNKRYELNELQTAGHVEYTIECRRKPEQGKFKFP